MLRKMHYSAQSIRLNVLPRACLTTKGLLATIAIPQQLEEVHRRHCAIEVCHHFAAVDLELLRLQ